MPATQTAQLVASPDAAEILSVSLRSLWGMTAPRGPLACVRLGRLVRYDVRDLEAHIQANRHSAELINRNQLNQHSASCTQNE